MFCEINWVDSRFKRNLLLGFINKFRVINKLIDFAMKIFIEVKRLLRWIGVLEFNHPHSKMIQYFIIIIVCGNIISFILSTFWFFCFNAETIIEYARIILCICWQYFFVDHILSTVLETRRDLGINHKNGRKNQ